MTSSESPSRISSTSAAAPPRRRAPRRRGRPRAVAQAHDRAAQRLAALAAIVSSSSSDSSRVVTVEPGRVGACERRLGDRHWHAWQGRRAGCVQAGWDTVSACAVRRLAARRRRSARGSSCALFGLERGFPMVPLVAFTPFVVVGAVAVVAVAALLRQRAAARSPRCSRSCWSVLVAPRALGGPTDPDGRPGPHAAGAEREHALRLRARPRRSWRSCGATRAGRAERAGADARARARPRRRRAGRADAGLRDLAEPRRRGRHRPVRADPAHACHGARDAAEPAGVRRGAAGGGPVVELDRCT